MKQDRIYELSVRKWKIEQDRIGQNSRVKSEKEGKTSKRTIEYDRKGQSRMEWDRIEWDRIVELRCRLRTKEKPSERNIEQDRIVELE